MLQTLHIENIAVVERADITLGPGLNVLTGETGAGKSIIIDSLQAVLGSRVTRELIRTGEERALVTAVFSLDDSLTAPLSELGVTPEDGELILQRVISSDGKSNCRVCGVPVTASQLRELGALLLDIHGQNDGRRLLDEATHLKFLDGYGAYSAEQNEFSTAYDKYKAVLQNISRLRVDETEKKHQIEKLSDIIDELESSNLSPGEADTLEARHELLRNAGRLTDAVESAFDDIYLSDDSAIAKTMSAENYISRAVTFSSGLEQILKALSDARFLLEDSSEALRDFKASLDFSPDEYDIIETRLNTLHRLIKKYGGDEAFLLSKLEASKKRLDELEFSDDMLKKLEKELASLRESALTSAKRLTLARKDAAARLRAEITAQLKELNMPDVSFIAEISPIDSDTGFCANGADEIRFLMSANAGEAPGRISKIASGGELSRIMLAMKNVFAEKDSVPTLVFDEIDTGVSGIAANRVGEKLSALSRHKQILCVTHLPQIAVMADTHLLIEKSAAGGRTRTNVEALDKAGQIREIARLHGGDNISEKTIAGAADQLSSAEKYKQKAKS